MPRSLVSMMKSPSAAAPSSSSASKEQITANTVSSIRDPRLTSVTSGTRSAFRHQNLSQSEARTQNTFTAMTHTVTLDEKELSIPLYLEMNMDSDVKVEEQIAQTSRTVVYRAVLLNEGLAARVRSKEVVVKRFAGIVVCSKSFLFLKY